MSRSAAAALLGAILAAGCGLGGRSPEAPASPNLALGRPASLLGGHGDPALVTDGRLATEGAPSGPAGAVTLPEAHAAIVVDLGAARPVGALLLQANATDLYFVEASTDASAWTLSWRVAPMPDVPGLRTRTTVLPRPFSARWLRVRPATTRLAAVSELQAFEAEPPAWPQLDRSRPDSPLPLWPALTRGRVTELCAALASLLMLAVGWSVLARRSGEGPGEERARRGLLVALALASVLAWPNFLNFHYHGVVHTWEFFHYYMGGKYLPELGYTRLYACAATADADDGLDLRGRVMRDLRDNRLVPVEAELARATECRSAFSRQRWDEFRRDARFFRAAMGEDAWLNARGDHGFNGTPAWAVLAGLLARRGPASWPQITVLALLDVGLLLAVFAIIGRTFGLEAACIAAGYWGLNSLGQFGWTGGGLLRYDWLFWLVAGVAALRVGRPSLAGFALTYSALLRVFPACVLAGLALKWLADAAAERSRRPLARQGRFAVGAAAAGILFLAASTIMTGRTRIWGEFADNSAKHLATEAVNSIGLPVFLAYRHDARREVMTDPLLPDRDAAWSAHVAAAARNARPAQWVAGAAFVLLLLLAVRGRPDWVAALLGLGLMPMLMKLSAYYYGGLIAYAALWPVSPAAGLALTSFAWATNVIIELWSNPDEQAAWLSLAAVTLATGLTGAFAWRRRAARD